jgi:hypothetical protein
VQIPNLAGRLSSWVFKREVHSNETTAKTTHSNFSLSLSLSPCTQQFDFKLADILADIEMVNNAVVELKKSTKFTKIMHVVSCHND